MQLFGAAGIPFADVVQLDYIHGFLLLSANVIISCP
jgi:hypothetical protein